MIIPLSASPSLLFFSSSLARVFSINARRKMSNKKNDIRRFYYLVSRFTDSFFRINYEKSGKLLKTSICLIAKIYLSASPNMHVWFVMKLIFIDKNLDGSEVL